MRLCGPLATALQESPFAGAPHRPANGHTGMPEPFPSPLYGHALPVCVAVRSRASLWSLICNLCGVWLGVYMRVTESSLYSKSRTRMLQYPSALVLFTASVRLPLVEDLIHSRPAFPLPALGLFPLRAQVRRSDDSA